MVKFKFFVHCKGHKAGGYHNTHFAENKEHAKSIVEGWNKQYVDHHVDLISVTEITDEEFAEDYISF